MSDISAAMVKELRDRSGAGMMECKKALVETGGDMEAAAEWLRKSGLAKAVKRAGRIAAEGLIAIEMNPDAGAAAMIEVNCETDFVAKGDDFRGFTQAVARAAVAAQPKDLATLLELALEPGVSVEQRRQALVARIGENISVRRVVCLQSDDAVLASYLHGSRIGVIVEMAGGDPQVARDVAMHVAASRPVCVSEAQIPQELLAKEREVYAAQAAGSGKPANIVEKMVEGRLKKFAAEVTLLGQPFVKNPDVTVGELLRGAGAEVRRFERFEVGEGLEKRSGDFAAEVMSQVQKGH
jgi:elongation factor Ts